MKHCGLLPRDKVYVLEFSEGLTNLPSRCRLETTTSVGRAADNVVRITHPSVSRHHASLFIEITADGHRVLVRDESSVNGTFVDGVMVKGDLVELKLGVEVQFGTCKATLLEASAVEVHESELYSAGDLDFDAAYLSFVSKDHLETLYEFASEAIDLEDEVLLDRAANAILRTVELTRLTFVVETEFGAPISLEWTADGKRRTIPPDQELLNRCTTRRQVLLRAPEDAETDGSRTMKIEPRAERVVIPLTVGQTCVGFLGVDGGTVARQNLDDVQFLLLIASNIARSLRARGLLDEKTVDHAAVAEQTDDRAKDEFLANISQELRTPLHSIVSHAGIGLQRCQDGDDEDLRSYFRKIDNSARLLLELLNDPLDRAKMKSKKTVHAWRNE